MLGTEVASTIGKGLVDAASISLDTVLCTVTAALVWNLITWYKGLPTSSSHAIIGSLLGATYFSVSNGGESILWPALTGKVLVPMLVSPALGLSLAFTIMVSLTWVIHRLYPDLISRLFRRMQILSSGFLALNHGRNDAQKSMGIIALALLCSRRRARLLRCLFESSFRALSPCVLAR